MAEYEARYVYEIKCPSRDCPAPDKVKRDGFHGGKQRYECNGCGKKFLAEGQATRRQFAAKQIAAAVDKYYSGMSYKQVAEHMEDFHDVPEPFGERKIRCTAATGVVKRRQLMYRDYLPLLYLRANRTGSARRNDTR